MKITSLEITNVLGIEAARFDMGKPITIIGAGNGVGKSSIAESIRMIFGASAERVKLKGDYKSLVHDVKGAKKGIAALTLGDSEEAFSVELPKGDTNGDFSDKAALQFVLNPSLFASLPDDEKRSLLFAISGQKFSRAVIKDRLLELGADAKKVEEVMPFMAAGLPSAVQHAESKMKEHRGAWKAVTGEVYGSLKAEGWTVEVQGQRPTPEQIEQAKDLVNKALDNNDAEANLAKLQAAANLHAQWLASRPEDAEKQRVRLVAKLEADKEGLDAAIKQCDEAAQKAGDGPRVGLVHDFGKAVSVLIDNGHVKLGVTLHEDALLKVYGQYVEQYGDFGQEGDTEAKQKLPELERAVKLMQNTVANSEQALQQFDGVMAMPEPEKVDAEALKAAQQAAEQAKADLKDASDLHSQLLSVERQHADAEAKEKEAAHYHAGLQAWEFIAKSLSPDGIPTEYLVAALKPINARLEQSAADTGWPLVVVDTDMAITYGKRRYGLISKSEQYRADVMLAEAISHVSGLKLLLADAFDVLEPAAREQFLIWLDTLAVEGEIETAIALGTMAKAPQTTADTMNVFWLGSK